MPPLRRIAGLTRHELAELRSLRAQHGTHGALVARIRKHLDLEAVSSPWAQDADRRLAELEALSPALDGLGGQQERLAAQQQELVARGKRHERSQDELGLRIAGLESLETDARTARDVLAMTAFVSQLPPLDLRVSVITTTRGRADSLRTAVDSVLAQGHHDWQLVVAHDAGDAETSAQLAGLEDPRIVCVDRTGLNRAAALNLALDNATGDVVTYLDDDNTMLPHWLAAIAWVFSQEPDLELAYGGLARQHDGDPIPMLKLDEWDPLRLEYDNPIDQNALAHRRELPEARFDEQLSSLQDWELVVRLTQTATPRRIPMLAAVYRTDAPRRLSDHPERRELAQRIRRQAAGRRPLRVLGSNAMFPLISETYIGDELESLVDNGAELAYYREQPGISPMVVPRPVYGDFAAAVAEFRPDVVLMHWANYAMSELPRIEAYDLPFGVRVHSFDFDADFVRELLRHPLCAGVWTYPSEHYSVAGTLPLPPVFTSVRDMPSPPTAGRDAVVSISAGLPKKHWPLLFDALGRLEGMPRHVVTGITAGNLDVPGELAARTAEMADPVLLQVNLTRPEALALIARASVLIYSLLPEVRFGMPMSVVEGLCAGCCVIVPDRPECRDYAGPGFRGYRTAEDIVRHVEQVRRGGPAIENERAANMEYGRRRFCDPALGERFYRELRAGVERVRYGRLDAGLSAESSLE